MRRIGFPSSAPLLLLGAGLALSGCIGETQTRGYVISDMAIEQIHEGASREQVLIALGSPSTTADFGGEVFYYISQTTARPVKFMRMSVVDQRVLAVYFNDDGEAIRIANYGLQDGQVFDFVTRTTPTGGSDVSFVGQILGNVTRGAAPPAPGGAQPGRL